MEQIIYTSIASPQVDGGEIFKIISSAAQRNRERDVSGMLVLVDRRFFQAIEGPKANINALLAALQADNRHHSLRVLRRRTIVARQFGNWSMQRFKVHDIRTARKVFRQLMVNNDDAATVLRQFEAHVSNRSGIGA